MIRGSIDLGTNTCLLLVVEWDSSTRSIAREIADYSTIVRLGQGVDSAKRLQGEAIERTLSCLKTYSEALRSHGGKPGEAICVATAQARDAENGLEFFERVKKETGFQFRIISGDEEAELSFKGALLPGMKREKCAVIDIGGGSTELRSLKSGDSLRMGSVRFTERFMKSDPVRDEEFWAARSACDELFETLKPWRRENPSDLQLIGVAGTITTLAAWFLELKKFDKSKIDGLQLSRGDVHRMVEELKYRSSQEKANLPGIDRGRADVILAGALILWRAMEILDFPMVSVSTRGLRYGILYLN